MSQTDAILADLFAGRAITPQDALRRHRCFRLASVVHMLRADGFRIHSEMMSQRRRDGSVASFARYTLTDRRRARSLIAQRARDRTAAAAKPVRSRRAAPLKPARSRRTRKPAAQRAGRRA